MTPSSPDPTRFLRRSLRANASFSALTGAFFTLAGSQLAAFLAVEPPLLVTAVGVNLMGFAAALFVLASRTRLSATLATIVVALDVGWVLGTVALVYGDVLSRAGATAALGIANVVLAFAVLQAIGVRRLGGAPVVRRRAISSRAAWFGGSVFVALPLLQLLMERIVPLPIGPSRMLTIAVCALALIPVALLALARAAGGPASRVAKWTVVGVVPLLAIAHLLALARCAKGPFSPVPGGAFRAGAKPAPDSRIAAEGLRYAEFEVDPDRPRTLETRVRVHEDSLPAGIPPADPSPARRHQRQLRLRFLPGRPRLVLPPGASHPGGPACKPSAKSGHQGSMTTSMPIRACPFEDRIPRVTVCGPSCARRDASCASAQDRSLRLSSLRSARERSRSHS
jgi:hypothetical protein